MGWQWHQLDHMQIICTTLQTDNHANTSPLSFYRPDALPATQPTASKHWRFHTHFLINVSLYIIYVIRTSSSRRVCCISADLDRPFNSLFFRTTIWLGGDPVCSRSYRLMCLKKRRIREETEGRSVVSMTVALVTWYLEDFTEWPCVRSIQLRNKTKRHFFTTLRTVAAVK